MTELIELLISKPIYSKIETSEIYDSSEIQNVKFDCYCEVEKAKKTFNLELAKDGFVTVSKFENQIDPSRLHNYKGNLSIVEQYFGRCLSCQKYKVHYLLHIYSNRPIRKSNGKDPGRKHYIEKIGQSPKFVIKLEGPIKKYLEKENIELYQKALMNLHNGYGIGAFAYFRKVLETEIKKIVNDIASIDDERKIKIDVLKSRYEGTKELSHLYDEIFQYLPSSLKELGINPISFLYQQLSVGLHGGLTEEECLNKSYQMNKIFPFVIKKINEEKSEIKEIREAIKKMK